MAKHKSPRPWLEQPPPAPGPFAALQGQLAERPPAGPARVAPAFEPESTRGADHISLGAQLACWLAGARQLRLARQTQGRAGKTIWVVAGIGALPAGLQQHLLQQIKRRLGCGAYLERGPMGGQLCVQGDQGQRLGAVLRQLGAAQLVGPE